MTAAVRTPGRQRGFSIALIIASVALLAALGAAIAISTRLGAMMSSHNTEAADAMTLINQASNIREGIKLMVARGTPLESISMDANDGTTASTGYTINTTGLYHPTLGGTEPQVPPRPVIDEIFSGTSSPYYSWHLITDGAGNPMVKLNGVGTSAADLVVALVGIKGSVCQMINKILLGTSLADYPPALPASGTGASVPDDWGNRPSATLVDLSAVAGMGQPEQCIKLSDGTLLYYALVRAY